MRKLKNLLKKLVQVLIFSCPLILIAGEKSSKIDSLTNLLSSVKQDTNRVKILNDLAWELKYQEPDSTISLGEQAVKLSQKLNWKKGEATGYGMIGIGYKVMGAFHEALRYFLVAIKLDEALGDIRSLAKHMVNVGNIYTEQGNYARALGEYLKALRMAEDLGLKKFQMNILGNVGNIYGYQKDNEKALEYFTKVLEIAKTMGDRSEMARTYDRIGIIYSQKKNFPKALETLSLALTLSIENGDSNLEIDIYGNIGNIYQEQSVLNTDPAGRVKQMNEALANYFKGLKLAEKLGNDDGIETELSNIGVLFITQKKYVEARDYLNRGLEMAGKIGDKEGSKTNYFNLAYIDSAEKDYKRSFEHYKMYVLYRDSLQNEEETKKQTQNEMQYEFDKKQTADSIKNSEQVKQENIKHEQEIGQQRIYTLGGIIGFVLMLAVAGVSFRAFKNKQKTNVIISHQKQLVEEKQKEILDSIHYAKRIQNSLLPPEKYIHKNLNKT